MPYNPIYRGEVGNDRLGDPDRTAWGKANAMFAELQLGIAVKYGEIISANDPVYLDVSGSPAVLYMFKADATDTTKPATGFVLADGGPDDDGVYFPLGAPLESPDSPPPFVMGTHYYLGAGGGLTSVKPSAAGNGVQHIGQAVTDSLLVTWLRAMDEVPGL